MTNSRPGKLSQNVLSSQTLHPWRPFTQSPPENVAAGSIENFHGVDGTVEHVRDLEVAGTAVRRNVESDNACQRVLSLDEQSTGNQGR